MNSDGNPLLPHSQSSTSLRLLRALGLSLSAWLALPAHAVLIDSGDGSGNTTPPADDPGFVHVGERYLFSAVYLGNGWVLTANHTDVGSVVIDGIDYPEVPGSKVQFDDGGIHADLMAFRIDPAPALPILPINADPNLTGESVIKIGNGLDRGGPVTACSGIDGYSWGGNTTIRWGTNHIAAYQNISSTESFYTTFDQAGSSHEAQVTTGDSGGAVFVKNGSTWELAGILFALANHGTCQPVSSSLYGDHSYAVDLATYRTQIISTVRPECSDEVDNDGDSLTDFPTDPDCESLADDSESTPAVPSLGTAGLTALAAVLLAGAAGPLRHRAARRPLRARAAGGGGPTTRTTPDRVRTRP